MQKKIAGWVLTVAGLLVIFWGIYGSYQIFTGQKGAPAIFSSSEEGSIVQGEDKNQMEAIQDMISGEFQKLLPIGFISDLLNLAAWSIFAMILFFGGGKVSEIGIKLIAS